MKNLIERFKSEFTPLKGILLVVMIAIFLGVLGFIGFNVYNFYIADNGTASLDTMSYALETLGKTGVV